MTVRQRFPSSDRSATGAAWRALLREPMFLVGLALVAGLLALYMLPILAPARLADWSEGPVFVPLLAWVVLATFARSRRAPATPERDFWRLMAFGFACWLAATWLTLLAEWRTGAPVMRLVYDALCVAFYLALFLATTKAPHDPQGAAQRHGGEALVALGTLIFGIGMTIYFDLVPFLLDRADFESRVPAFYLFLALDLSLVARAASLVRAARDPSWRWPYALLLLATLLLSLGDCLDMVRQLGMQLYVSGTATDFLWYGVEISIALAAILRQTGLPPAAPSGQPGTLSSSPLLTFAFIVPLVHFAFSGAGVLGERSQHPREAVALATMAGILLVAWWHQRRRERSHLALERELEHERVRLRNAERLETVGRMAGGVAHDFNNQLAIVLGYTELLAREAADRPDQLEHLCAIREAATCAADLTKELLSVGRRQTLLAREFDLNEAVRKVEAQLRALAGPAVTLEVELAAQPALVIADRAEIERAILTLAKNSIEAMPLGGRLRLRVALPPRPSGGDGPPDRVTLEVADDGVGMSPEVLAHALEPFFTTKPFGQGSGLGLAAVNGAVAQLGGELEIESAPGRGTCVRLFLPQVATGGAERI